MYTKYGTHNLLSSRRYDPLALPRSAYAYLLLVRLLRFGILLTLPAMILSGLLSLGAGLSDPGLFSQPYPYLVSLAMTATILIWTVMRDFAARHSAESGAPRLNRNLLQQVVTDDMPAFPWLDLWRHPGRNRTVLRAAVAAYALLVFAAFAGAIMFIASVFLTGPPLPAALGWISLAMVVVSLSMPLILFAISVRRPVSDAPLQQYASRQRLWRIALFAAVIILAFILLPVIQALLRI